MENKTIVTVGPAYPYRGGQTIVEASIHGKLQEAGYDCHTVSFSLLYPNVLFPGTTQFDSSKNLFNPHLEKTYRLINSINPITWIKAYKKIKALKPAKVIFIWWMPFFGPCYSVIAWLLRKNTNAQIIFLIENFISHEKRWFDLFLTKLTLRWAHNFITHSKHIQEKVKLAFPSKKVEYTSLPSFDFFDQKRFDQKESRELLGIKESNVILFFGLIRKYKGLDQLIKSFSLILAEKPDTKLLIVGECYEDISVYTKLIDSLGLQEHIVLVNKFIDNEDVEPYFKAADLVVLPYYSGTQSGILMMAYGFRKPVVASNVGGVAELIAPDKTGQLIEDNDPEKIKNAVLLTLEQRKIVDFENNIQNLSATLGYKDFAELLD